MLLITPVQHRVDRDGHQISRSYFKIYIKVEIVREEIFFARLFEVKFRDKSPVTTLKQHPFTQRRFQEVLSSNNQSESSLSDATECNDKKQIRPQWPGATKQSCHRPFPRLPRESEEVAHNETKKKRNKLSRGRRNVHVPEVRVGRASLPRAFPVERLIAALLPLSLTRHLLPGRRRISLPFPLPILSPPLLYSPSAVAVFRSFSLWRSGRIGSGGQANRAFAGGTGPVCIRPWMKSIWLARSTPRNPRLLLDPLARRAKGWNRNGAIMRGCFRCIHQGRYKDERRMCSADARIPIPIIVFSSPPPPTPSLFLQHPFQSLL